MALTKVTGQVIKDTTDVTVGVLTVTNTLSVGGTVSIGGTLTYEDVTNVDAVGLITARNGIVVGSGITLSKDGDIFATGISTFSDDVNVSGNVNITGNSDFNMSGGNGRFVVSSSVDAVGVFTSTDSNATLDLFDDDTQTRFRNVDGSFFLSADHQNAVADSEIRFLVDGTNQAAIDGDGHFVFANDTDTYFHRPEANRLAFVTNGTERLRIDNTGRVMVGTTTEGNSSADDLTVATSSDTGITIRSGTSSGGNIYFSDGTSGADEYRGVISYDHASNFMQFYTNASEALRIESNTRVLVGHTDNIIVGGHLARLQISGTDYNQSTVSIMANSNDANGAYLMLGHQRSGSAGGTTILNDGDEVGVIRFAACDGSDIAHATAEIRSEVDGTPGANDMPGRLVFKTTADGGTSKIERMRINSSGQVNIGAASPTASENGQLNVYITTSSGKAQIVHSAGTGGLRLAGTGSGSGSNLIFSNNYNSGTFDDQWTINADGGNDYLKIKSGGTGGTERLNILPAGDVHVRRDGNGEIFRYLRSGTQLFVIDNLSTDSNTRIRIRNPGGSISYNSSTSDISVKKNFESWDENVLDLFKNINPQKFNFKQEEDGTEKTKGFIAQEMVGSFPEAYNKGDEENAVYYFDPSGMVVYLMKGLQEAQSKIEVLEAEVAALKSS